MFLFEDTIKNMKEILIETNLGRMNQALINFLVLHFGMSARVSLFIKWFKIARFSAIERSGVSHELNKNNPLK